MQREARYIYLLILGKNGQVYDLIKTVAWFEKYEKFRKNTSKPLDDKNLPPYINNIMAMVLPPVKMPQYLKWVKKYLIKTKSRKRKKKK